MIAWKTSWVLTEIDEFFKRIEEEKKNTASEGTNSDEEFLDDSNSELDNL